MNRGLSQGLIVVLMLSSAVWAQSQSGETLGDVARANRDKQQADQATGVKPKVFTNQDVPADPPGTPKEARPEAKAPAGAKKPNRTLDSRPDPHAIAQERLTEQWKARLQEQENRIAELQARLDHVNAAIRTAGGTAQYETPANRTQAIQIERMNNLQVNLDQQRRKLEQMQDEARHAGAGQ